jgi:hypothetical protein
MKTWIVGERIRVTCQGRQFEAVVHLVGSEGQPSAVGGYEGLLAGFMHWCPLLWIGEHAQTLSGVPVEVEPSRVTLPRE